MIPHNIDLLLKLSWLKYDPDHENLAHDITLHPDPEWELVSRGDIEEVSEGWRVATVHRARVTLWPRSPSRKEVDRTIKAYLNDIRELRPSTIPNHILPGWSIRFEDVEAGEPVRCDSVRLTHNARLEWATLVAPDSSYNAVSLRNPKNSLRIDCVFEAYAQLLRGTEGFQKETRWTTFTVERDLTPDPNHRFGFGTTPSPISSIEDLKIRFQRALLNRDHDFMVRWRDAKGISVHSVMTLETPVPLNISPEITQKLGDMFDSEGLEMAYAINPYHEKARHIIQVVVAPFEDGFTFALFYGYDGSSWVHTLAETRGSEPFERTCLRAYEAFKTMVPDLDSQRIARRHRPRR